MFYESLIRPLLFRLDAETVHELGMAAISRGFVSAPHFEDKRLEQTLFGCDFRNPLGLAAGFDKNGVGVSMWRGLGFGFAEIGTVTWHPQSGNPKPRLFRFPEEQAIFNRMGFNNDGAEAIGIRLQAGAGEDGIPLGINLGKSKVTPLEEAADDYARSYRALESLGDYFVVNVSSPNTPGLRTLQDAESLRTILKAIPRTRPIFVKASPDLTEPALAELIGVAVSEKATGLILTNTTIQHEHGQGGLSGAPLRGMAERSLSFAAKEAPRELILIGVGGIFTAADLWNRIRLGAHLCQLYTGWIYGGPGTVPRILEEFCERIEREGVSSVAELRLS